MSAAIQEAAKEARLHDLEKAAPVSGAAALPKMMTEMEMVRDLKLFGLHAVTADALASIYRQIAKEPVPKEALKTLAQKLRAYVSGTGRVDNAAVLQVVAAETRNEEDTKQDAYSIVSSFDFPRWSYDAARKSYFW
jgi:hypothetical protein